MRQTWKQWRDLALVSKARKRMHEGKSTREALIEISKREKRPLLQKKPDISPVKSPKQQKMSHFIQSPKIDMSTIRNQQNTPKSPKIVQNRYRKEEKSVFRANDLGQSIVRIRLQHAVKKLILVQRKAVSAGFMLRKAFRHWEEVISPAPMVLKLPEVTVLKSPKSEPKHTQKNVPKLLQKPPGRNLTASELQSLILTLKTSHVLNNCP